MARVRVDESRLAREGPYAGFESRDCHSLDEGAVKPRVQEKSVIEAGGFRPLVVKEHIRSLRAENGEGGFEKLSSLFSQGKDGRVPRENEMGYLRRQPSSPDMNRQRVDGFATAILFLRFALCENA